MAFFGSVTNRGLSSIGTYVTKNSKAKLKLAFKNGIEAAHRRAQLRGVLRGKLEKGIEFEEAVGYITTKYSELQVRELCAATNKSFVKKVVDECNEMFGAVVSPQATRRRKMSSMQLSFEKSRVRRSSSAATPPASSGSTLSPAFSLTQATQSALAE